MNPELLNEMWERLDYAAQREILVLAQHPTERNGCYTTGYFAALYHRQIINHEAYPYWLAAIGQIENDPDFRKEVLNLSKGETK